MANFKIEYLGNLQCKATSLSGGRVCPGGGNYPRIKVASDKRKEN